MKFKGFGAEVVPFFEELALNNNRNWWLANKPRYDEHIREPLELLLDDLAPEFGEAKVFRPNRDIRFSPDKSPYKTQASAVIHGDEGSTSLYMALSATGLSVGGGSYTPAKDQMERLRAAIADDGTGAEIEDLTAKLRKAKFSIWARETLKTAPRGYAADHPRIDLLRMKGVIAIAEHPPAKWFQTARARDKVADDWRALGPLNKWLSAHVGPTDLPPTRR
jgi:uncharacterized protein (TIGR02453 family)